MICVTLTFVVVGIYANTNNILNPIINEMNITCNYKDFDLKLQEIEEVENLHSDSKAYLNLLRCNYLEYISPKKTTELFMSIKKPTSAFYKRCYDELEILNYIRSGDYDKAKELIDKHRKAITIDFNTLTLMENTIKIDKGETIKDVEKVYKLDNKEKFKNIVSAYNLMCYYSKQDNIDKAKEYAKMLLDYQSDFTYINNLAKEVLK